MNTTGTTDHLVVSNDAWMKACADHLAKEKEFTRLREDMARRRRDLPWVRVEKDYIFEGPDGPVSLSDLFNGRSQLVAYHFMFGPGEEEGCPGCSFVCDHVDSSRQHFEHNDLSFAAISRGPVADFAPFKKRMGWTFPWVSSNANTFSYDFGASFRREDLDAGPVHFNFKDQKLSSEDQPGLTVFFMDEEGTIYRTYSTYDRGLDMLIGAYNYLDLAPKGRNESGPMSWMSHHDRYDDE